MDLEGKRILHSLAQSNVMAQINGRLSLGALSSSPRKETSGTGPEKSHTDDIVRQRSTQCPGLVVTCARKFRNRAITNQRRYTDFC